MIVKYKIVLQKSEEGYSVRCIGLPGCWSQGETEEEAIANIKDAIKEYLEVAEELFQEGEIREVEVAVQECQNFRALTISKQSKH